MLTCHHSPSTSNSNSVLQITSGHDQLQHTVESSWAWLLRVLVAWASFDESRNKLHKANRSGRKSETQEQHRAYGKSSK